MLRSGATALQTPAYFEAVLTATGGRDDSRLYSLEDGCRLVLPLVGQRAVPGVRVNATFPGGYGHGGMLGPSQNTSSAVALTVLPGRARGGRCDAGKSAL